MGQCFKDTGCFKSNDDASLYIYGRSNGLLQEADPVELFFLRFHCTMKSSLWSFKLESVTYICKQKKKKTKVEIKFLHSRDFLSKLYSSCIALFFFFQRTSFNKTSSTLSFPKLTQHTYIKTISISNIKTVWDQIDSHIVTRL